MHIPLTSLAATKGFLLTSGLNYTKRFIEPLDTESTELSLKTERSTQTTRTAKQSRTANVGFAFYGRARLLPSQSQARQEPHSPTCDIRYCYCNNSPVCDVTSVCFRTSDRQSIQASKWAFPRNMSVSVLNCGNYAKTPINPLFSRMPVVSNPMIVSRRERDLDVPKVQLRTPLVSHVHNK